MSDTETERHTYTAELMVDDMSEAQMAEWHMANELFRCAIIERRLARQRLLDLVVRFEREFDRKIDWTHFLEILATV